MAVLVLTAAKLFSVGEKTVIRTNHGVKTEGNTRFWVHRAF